MLQCHVVGFLLNRESGLVAWIDSQAIYAAPQAIFPRIIQASQPLIYRAMPGVKGPPRFGRGYNQPRSINLGSKLRKTFREKSGSPRPKMKFTTLSIIASLALSSTATPVPQTPPEQFPALLSVVSLYTSKDCTFPAGGSGFDNGWTLTTRMDTWNGFLKKTDGCQPIRGPKAETPDPTILSFMPRILSPECTGKYTPS